MDKPAERLTRGKQFRVRVPIGAIFTRYIGDESEGKRIQTANQKLRHTSKLEYSSNASFRKE